MNADMLVPILGDWNNNGRPLNESLADALSAAVQRGELEPGVALPAERVLARSLNVSRGTVVAAYRRLRDHGLAHTRHGSGTTIDGETQSARSSRMPFVNLLRRYDGDVLSFRSADWNGDALPAELFADAVPAMASLSATAGYFPTGLPELREAIAAHLGRTGLETAPDQILVTTGAQQAIALLIGLFVTPGVPVAVEQLSYPGALDALRTAGAVLHAVPMTPAGVDVPALERVVRRQRPVLTYIVPGVHNPTGLVGRHGARGGSVAGRDPARGRDRAADLQLRRPRRGAAHHRCGVAEQVGLVWAARRVDPGAGPADRPAHPPQDARGPRQLRAQPASGGAPARARGEAAPRPDRRHP
jgi:DNA-binding transcriptional regulator YhcF (GntR family)